MCTAPQADDKNDGDDGDNKKSDSDGDNKKSEAEGDKKDDNEYSEEDKKSPEYVVNKFYELHHKRATEETLALFAENIAIINVDKFAGSCDGIYRGKQGYLRLVSQQKASFTESGETYRVSGLNTLNNVIGETSVVRTFKDGNRFTITATQTFTVNEDGKITNILSQTTSSTKLTSLSGLRLKGPAASIQVHLMQQ